MALIVVLTASYSVATQVTTKSGHNRLINESSPYLQQHASNPIDWYP